MEARRDILAGCCIKTAVRGFGCTASMRRAPSLSRILAYVPFGTERRERKYRLLLRTVVSYDRDMTFWLAEATVYGHSNPCTLSIAAMLREDSQPRTRMVAM